ncbi:polymorphic toxin-type HINT domain-containing protein [Vibrio azureus]|uniref:polymorphic toxin-type HINT domain-containing protein n=1 Tax=Vibrio azureus TaxID=512649 RepID=UPI0003A27AEF|nr:polymorphic toxin-type HINT domain-containing protein [Vibrio azureus]
MSNNHLINKTTIWALLVASFLPGQAISASSTPTLELSGEYKTSGGNATYSVPISIAPGRAGHQPVLNLRYQSNLPNGLMGIGWQLGGQSTIYRCGKNLNIDGLKGGVGFNQEDRYCLDGERLIAVNGADGKDLTEYRVKKNGYDKIVSFGDSGGSGPAYFKIWRTDGSVLEYGVSADSRVELPNQSHVYKWAINKKTDASKHNHIQYQYREDNAAGIHQLRNISYVGGKVEFRYEDRKDKSSQYLFGSVLNRTERLKQVVTFDADAKQIGTYGINYRYSNETERSLVNKVQYCSVQGACSTPIDFEWVDELAQNSMRKKSSLDFARANYFDVDRDGNKELYGVEILESHFETCSSRRPKFNPNIWAQRGRYRKTPGKIRRLDGTYTGPGDLGSFALIGSIDSPALYSLSVLSPNGVCGPHETYDYWRFADVKDVSNYTPELDGSMKQYGSNLKFAADLNGDGKQTLQNKPTYKKKPRSVKVIDIDNDGRDDWVYVDTDHKRLIFRLSQRNHAVYSLPVQTRSYGGQGRTKEYFSLSHVNFRDINNDGYLDFSVIDLERRGVSVYLFDGKNYIKSASSQSKIFNLSSPHPINIIDFNANGYPELCLINTCWANEAGKINFQKPRTVADIKDVYLVDDLNGDGVDDFVGSVGESSSKYQAYKQTSYKYQSEGKASNRIKAIKEALKSFEINYSSATNKTVHTQKRYFDYPFLNTTPVRYLVREVIKIPLGAGYPMGQYYSLSVLPTRYSYNYEGAKYHALGGGFLGFETITEVESIAFNLTSIWLNSYEMTTTVSHYNQLDLKKAGELKKVEVYKHVGKRRFIYQASDKITSTSYEYQTVDKGNGAYQVYPSKVIKQQFESGALQKTTQVSSSINAFGAITREETTVSNALNRKDRFTTRVDNQYLSQGYSTTSYTYNTITSNTVSYMAAKFARYQDGLTAYCSTTSKDIYFKPEDRFVLIHGDVDTPILVTQHQERFRYHVTGTSRDPYNGITQQTGALSQISQAEFDRQTLTPCGQYQLGNVIGDSQLELSTTTNSVAQSVTQTGQEYWKVGARSRSVKTITDHQSGLSKTTQNDYSYNSQGLLSQAITSGSEYETGMGGGGRLAFAYQYDTWGNVVSESQSGSDLPTRTTRYGFEANGLKLKTTTNAKGHTIRTVYDGQGRLVSETSALKGRTTRYEYDAFGREVRRTLPGKNNRIEQTYQLGAQCEHRLSTTASCVTTTQSNGVTQVMQYDYADREVRRLHRAFDGRWVVVDTGWDRQGHKTFVTTAQFLDQKGKAPRVTFEYDKFDREIRRIEPANRGTLAIFTTQYKGFRIEGTDARGFKRSTTHNVMGHVIRKDEPLGAYQTYQYYPDGKLKRTQDSAGNITQIQYDNLGYRTQLDDPDIGHWYYRYNALGELVYKRDANGVVTQVEYDTLGRKVSQKEGNETSQWRYDERGALGTLSWMSGKGQRSDYFYDQAGLLQEKAVTVGKEIFSTQYTYDAFERIAREVRPDGKTKTSELGKPDNQRLAVEYVYNQYGYVSAVRSPKTFADDIFASAKFREDIRQLLQQSINQANLYLQRASRYAKQEGFFREKYHEYRNKQVDVFNLDEAAANQLKDHHRYKQWCDQQGTCYLRPATWVILHDDVTIPLDVTLEGDIFRIDTERTSSGSKDGLATHEMTANPVPDNALDGLTLTQMQDMLMSGDYDGNGTLDMMRQGDIYAAKADDSLRGELLFAAEDLEQAANIAHRQYKEYRTLASDLLGLVDKVAKLSGVYCDFANTLGGDRVNASLRGRCQSSGGVSQADMLDTILTNAELAAANNSDAYVYYWQRQSTDAFDHTLSEMLGNGLMNTYEHDVNTGRVNVIATYEANKVFSSDGVSKPSRAPHIRQLRYKYDNHDNVTERYDEQLGITDRWTYDALDRVDSNTIALADKTQHGLNNPDLTGKRSYRYDKLGNIVYKSDIGDYQYSGIGAGPHAVTQANGLSYQYDAAGNMLSAKAKGSKTDERILRWSPYNKPTKIIRKGKTVEFSYDANHERYLKRSSDGTVTFYFGKTYERVKNLKTGEIQHQHFVFADGKLIALNTQTTDSNNKLKNKQIRYLHYDALESVDMVTDGYGLVVEKRSYDTWGKQRHVLWQDSSAASVIQAAITNRGYTGHEEITEVGLIHMNGRVYDQELGRFVSADPLVQAPYVVNSFNRYSYVMNNPLKYTDPKGYFCSDADGSNASSSCDVGSDTSSNDSTGDSNGRSSDGKGSGDSTKNNESEQTSNLSSEGEQKSQAEEEVESGGWISAIAGLAYDLSPISTVVDIANGVVETGEALAAGEFKQAGMAVGGALFGVVAKKFKAPVNFYKKVSKKFGKQCFIRGTMIHVQGGLKPIEDIQVGDLVASKDELTGDTDWKPVVTLFRNENKRIFNLTLLNGDGEKEQLGVTAEHPFWVEGQGWVEAGVLEVGQRISTVDGAELAVHSIAYDEELHTTYNFEVGDYHSYFVGENGAWVHNDCSSPEFESIPKHGKIKKGKANPEPTNPQQALDNSIELPGKTTRRVSVDKQTGEFSVFDEHTPGKFHGHSRTWKELDQTMQATLRKAGLVNKKGKIK